MDLHTVRKAIYDQLRPAASNAGFENTELDLPFRRQTESGHQSIIITIMSRNPSYVVGILAGVRIDAVDDIVNPLSQIDPDYRHKSHTFMLGPEYFTGTRLTWVVASPREIGDTMARVTRMLQDDFFPLLDRTRSLDQGDRLLNDGDLRKFRTVPERLAAVSVVSAALCKRPDFDAIVDRRRESVSGFYEGLRNNFEAVVVQARAL